jgi:predicted MFS family arabinose efflux permease
MVPVRALLSAYPGRLLMLVSVAFLGNLGGNPQGFFFSKYLQEAHGWSPANVSSLYFIGGALGIMGNIVSGRLSDRFGRRRMGAFFYFMASMLAFWLYSSHSAARITGVDEASHYLLVARHNFICFVACHFKLSPCVIHPVGRGFTPTSR